MDPILISKRLQIVEDLAAELEVLKENLEEALENDAQYQKVQEEENKFKDEVKEKKARITAKDSYQHLQNALKEKRQEIKENKEVLSQDLVDYYKESGEIQIEDHRGDLKRMIFSVKLVRN